MQLLTIRGGWSRNRRFEINNGSIRIQKDGGKRETTLTIENGQITEIEDIEHPTGSPGERIVTTKDWDQIENTKAGVIRTVSRYKNCWNLPFTGAFHEMQGF